MILLGFFCFFFNDTATTEIYTLSLHDALPTCQACPDIWKTSVDGPPIRATATISLVESELPAVRHETVAAVAIAAIRATGSSQSAPRTMPTIRAIGTCTHSTAIKALLVVSRNLTRSSLSM